MESNKSVTKSLDNNLHNVISELEWGLRYRQRLKAEKRQQEQEVHCKKIQPKLKPNNPCKKFDELFDLLKLDGKKMYAEPFLTIRQEEKRSRKFKEMQKKMCCTNNTKPTVIDRDSLTRKQYLDFLATPRGMVKKKKCCPKRKKRKCKCRKVTRHCIHVGDEILSPRIKKLSLPTKTRVYATCCQYLDVLEPEVIERLQEILIKKEAPKHMNDCEANKYFQKKRKQKRKSDKLKKRKNEDKHMKQEKKLMQNEINILADLIVHKIATKPLEVQNNRHMQLTRHLIEILRFKGYKIKPINRNTKKFRDKVTLQIVDHISVWCDQVVQKAEQLSAAENIRKFEEMLDKQRAEKQRIREEKAKKERLKQEEEAEEEGEGSLDSLNLLKYKQDKEVIETLITILESNEGRNLNVPIRYKVLKNVTYKQVLDKLRSLRDDKEVLPPIDASMHSLKHEILKWTKKNRPNTLSCDAKRAIAALSQCLLEFFTQPEPEEEEEAVDEEEQDIPEYNDPNEDMEEGEGMHEGEDDYFDPSMYVGIQ